MFNVIPCNVLGTPAGADVPYSPNSEYNHYLFDNTRDILRSTGYILFVPKLRVQENYNYYQIY